MTDVVRGERRGRRWTRLAHGVYSDGPMSFEEQFQGWRLVLPPGAVFTHLTAARLRGWWLPANVGYPIFVAVAVGDRYPQRRELCVIRQRTPPVGEMVAGVPVATAPETLLAAARDLAALDLVPLLDSALRDRTCSSEQLITVGAGRPGGRQLRAALSLADPRSESAWESIMRVLHRAAGIDVEPQHHLYDANGRFVARADLWVVGTRRLHEYDGEVHRDLSVHRTDLDRDRRLLDSTWQRYGYTASEVLSGGGLIASVDAALGRPWDGARLRTWRQLVDDSWWGRAGQARAAARWPA